MKRVLIALAALLSSPAAAETLVHNVNGIQANADGTLQHFTGLLIGDDGKVRAVLTGPAPAKTFEHMIDGQGCTLLPGLIDGHGHVMALGLTAIQLDLVGTTSLEDLRQRLATYAAQHPDDTWIVGRGWNQELWPDKMFPTAADLDSIVGDRPVVLARVDGHAVVANSAALRIAGVTAASKDPSGGKIERDSSGRPTGLLVDSATELVESKIPAAGYEQKMRALMEAQAQLLAVGITAAADMGTSAEDWAVMEDAARYRRLQVRILAYSFGLEPLPRIAANGPVNGLFDDHLSAVGVKLYGDGALGSRGAWLKRPYADKPDTHGLQFHSDAELLSLADKAAAAGFQVATHAIGDAANAQAIAIYEALTKKYGRDRRWRIEHFQIADPADIERLEPAGIIASMQPTHQTSDRLMAEARLGPARLKGAYAWRSVLSSGARLAFGSDFPVESPNPFPGLSAAISRQDLDGQPPGGWIPSERLTLGEALRAFTRDAAYAGFAETRIGALEPGKWADFILVDRDPAKIDAQSLGRTQVLQTWVSGKKVWERASAAPERGK